MQRAILIISFLIVLLSCQERQIQQSISLRDSALNEYLSRSDSILGFDTTNSSYQFLRAYQKNDTAYLAKYLRQQSEWDTYTKTTEYKRDIEYPDSCVQQLPLYETTFEETYRFKYRQSFCPYWLNVTVGRIGDSAELQFILYKPAIDHPLNNTGCSIISQFKRKLTSAQWQQFNQSIEFADFWALNAQNGIQGLDGNNLEVEGYLNEESKVRRPPKYHKIYRWIGSPMAINDAFHELLRLSGNKEGCIVIK
jgi:hypothetical protein